nr:AKT interacting protein [Hymenolepis microstoma]
MTTAYLDDAKSTYDFSYNPKEYQCHNTRAQTRLNAPYILYSTHKSGQYLDASIPKIEASEFEDMIQLRSAKKDEDELDNRLAELEPQVKPPKCPWVPPCGPAFGSKIKRITGPEVRNSVPPPGTYNPHDSECKQNKSQQKSEPWSLTSPLPTKQMANLRKRLTSTIPSYYNLKSPLEIDLENLARRSHSFDAYNLDRSARMQHGYFAAPKQKTEFRNVSTFADLPNNNGKKNKGTFLKAERFPKKYGERICQSAPGYSVDKEINTSPVHYNIGTANWKMCELKSSSKIPFGSHGNNIITQKQYNQQIGNMTPYTGPGRYDPFKYEKKTNKNRYVNMAKRTGRDFNFSMDEALRERIRPKNETNDFWNGIISVRKGYYCGGSFPFKVEIPDDFPSFRPPKIVLAHNFYHPYVHSATGELDLGPEFEKWVPGSSHIYHVLHYFRCVFNDLSIESVDSNSAKKFANPEVAQTFISEHEKFEIRARTYVEDHSLWSSTDSTSTDSLLNSLSVIGWQNDNLISTIRDKIANSAQPFKNCPCCSDTVSRGYSWIDPSKMTLFSPRLLCNEKSD